MNRTIQREEILRELRLAGGHPTADDIYISLRKKLPQISLATIYRNLEQMTEKKIISKVHFCGRQKRFDAETARHFHIYCPQCGKITNTDLECFYKIDNEIKKIIAAAGLDDYFFELINLCDKCRSEHINSNKKHVNKPKVLSLLD